jgi:AcrR family transcriptional regulator
VQRPSAELDRAVQRPGGDHRRRPRRRGSALEAAILEATLAEIDAYGYAGMSLERVAERARASKASLYRRWPSKVDLVMAAVRHLLPHPDDRTDTGSVRGDVLALFRDVARVLAGPAGIAIRGLISDVLRDPALTGQLQAYTRGRSLAMMQDIVQRGIERGELRSGVRTSRQLEAGLSLLRFHFLTHGGPVSDEVIVEVVEEVVLPLFSAVPQPAQARPRSSAGCLEIKPRS